MSFLHVPDDISENMMNKPAGVRFFRRAGATIQSSGAIDTIRKFFANQIILRALHATGIVVQNAGRHIAQIEDVIAGFRALGVNVTKVNNFKSSTRRRHTTDAEGVVAEKDSVVEDTNPSNDNATTMTNDEPDVEEAGDDNSSQLTSNTTVSHRRRAKPGAVARRQVRALQRSNQLLIQPTPFRRAVRNISTLIFPVDDTDERSSSNLKFSKSAILLLQTVAEAMILSLVSFACDVTHICRRKEVSDNDVNFAINHINYKLG